MRIGFGITFACPRKDQKAAMSSAVLMRQRCRAMRDAPRSDVRPPCRIARQSPITASAAMAPKMENAADSIPYNFPLGRDEATNPNVASARPQLVANKVNAQ